MTRAKMLSALASHLVGAERRGEAEVVDLTHDSRQVRPGLLFCAMRGRHDDGHRFSADAVEAGASALLVERFLDIDVPQVRVPSVRHAVGQVAAAVFDNPSAHLSIAGVTGTNGKTTTAFLIERAFAAAGWRTGLLGTIETRIAGRGTPSAFTTPEAPDLQRALASMVAKGVHGVAMEVSSHGLDQHRLDGTQFKVALFTNLAAEHLDYHGTMEQYWSAKAKLFAAGRCRRAVVCIDDEWGVRLAAQAEVPVTTFGTNPDADVVMKVVSSDLSGTAVRLSGALGEVELYAPLIGSCNAQNIAGAYLAALSMGVPMQAAALGIAGSGGVPGRFEVVEAGSPFMVVVDYAHTPNALAALIDTARSVASPGGRVIVVVGSRGGRDRLKRPQTGRVAASADIAILTSDSPGYEDPGTIVHEMMAGTLDVAGADIVVELDRRRAIETAVSRAGPGDVVLLVGRGHETSQNSGGRAVPFDDRLVAQEMIRALPGAPSVQPG